MRAASTEAVARQLRAATSLPLWVKLPPNTGDLPPKSFVPPNEPAPMR
jgi:dihydroorotate dehydrogenase (NAD+) catalytic subunit